MLKETMEKLMKDHSHLREKIENDAWEEIDLLRDKNKEELAKHIDAGMDSKCSLTMINNDYRLKRQAKEEEQRKISEKQSQLNLLYKQTNNLKQTIESQEGELKERATTIEDKNKRINDLRKKT